MKKLIPLLLISMPCFAVVTVNSGTNKYTVDSHGAPVEKSGHPRNLSEIEYENEVHKFNEKEKKAYESLKSKGVWIW